MYFEKERDGKRLTVHRDTRGGSVRDSETYICKIYDPERAVHESMVRCTATGGITDLLRDMSKACAPEYAPLFAELLAAITPDTPEKIAVLQNVRKAYRAYRDAEFLKSKDAVYNGSFQNNFYISMYEFFMDEDLSPDDYNALAKDGEWLLDCLWDKYLDWDGVSVEATGGIEVFLSEYIQYAFPNAGGESDRDGGSAM
jgi:hypothetical protein